MCGAGVTDIGHPMDPIGGADPAAPAFVGLRHAWAGMLTCRDLSPPVREAHAALIADTLAHAARQHEWLDHALRPGGIDAQDPAERPPLIRGVAQALKDIAIATHLAKPGDPAVAGFPAAIAQALAALHRDFFNTRVAREGNWWEWEIGIPSRLLDLLALLPDGAVEARLRAGLLATVARCQPDPDRLHLGTSAATGANRVWSSSGFARRAILEGDPLRLQLGIRSLCEAIGTISGPDGFREDGSFLQHRRFAYTGGYGIDFLLRATEMAALLHGSPWALPEAVVARLVRHACDGLLPFMVDGAVMDMVRGREISRHAICGHAKGHMAMRALLVLAEVAQPEAALMLRQVVKQQIRADGRRDFFAFHPEAKPENIPLDVLVTARRALDDAALPPAPPLRGVFAFPEMDRVVLRAPTFALGVAMHGRRTASYESLNGENLRGWFTAFGMTGLHVGDAGHFQDGFWPTVDATRLPGTTVNRRALAPGEGRNALGSYRVGTVALGSAGVAAMELHADEGRLRARKSWFLFEDGVVALGSSIRDIAGEAVETIVENRNLGEGGTRQVTSDRRPVPELAEPGDDVDLSECRWLHVEGLGGYLFPLAAAGGGGRLRGRLERRSGSWREINDRPDSPDEPIHRTYLTLWLEHDARHRAGGYAYVLLPGCDAGRTAALAADGPWEILAHGSNLHAVRHHGLGVIAAVAWRLRRDGTPLAAGPLAIAVPACVMLRASAVRWEVIISLLVPLEAGTTLLRLGCAGLRPVALDPGLEAEVVEDGLALHLTMGGRSTLTLRASFAAPGA